MITIEHLHKVYVVSRQTQCTALVDFNATIADGELVAVTGPSGAGKSTLLHILAGIDRATSGTVRLDQLNISKMGDRRLASVRNTVTSIVLQHFALLDTETVFENVLLPLYFSRGGGKEKKRRVMQTLETLHIAPLAKKRVNQLSGGQMQRVAIARALVTQPKYLFADEPTGALDSKTSGEIMQVLQQLNRQGLTVVIVTHNMEIAQQCRRVLEIRDGALVRDVRQLTADE